MKIHHIGYLVKNMEKAIEDFKLLGYSVSQPTAADEDRGINITFMENGAYRVELVMAEGEGSIAHNLSRKIGNSPYHICYESDDFENDIIELKGNGFIETVPPRPATAIEGRDVIFLTGRNVGLLEIVRSAK